jgi:hypothetical protein
MKSLRAWGDGHAHQSKVYGAFQLRCSVACHWVNAGHASKAARIGANNFRHKLIGDTGIKKLGAKSVHQRRRYGLDGALKRSSSRLKAGATKRGEATQRFSSFATKLFRRIKDSCRAVNDHWNDSLSRRPAAAAPIRGGAMVTCKSTSFKV